MGKANVSTVVVLGDVDTEQRAEMLAIRAAEHGMIIGGIFAFGVGEVVSADDLTDVEQVIAALSRAIATGRDVWVPFGGDLFREQHVRRLCLVLQRHGLSLRIGPHLTPVPADGGYSEIDMALRAEVRAVDALDHAGMAAAAVRALSAEIDAALADGDRPSPNGSAASDVA